MWKNLKRLPKSLKHVQNEFIAVIFNFHHSMTIIIMFECILSQESKKCMKAIVFNGQTKMKNE